MANMLQKAIKMAIVGVGVFAGVQQAQAQTEVTKPQMRVNCQNGKPTMLFVNSNKTSLVGHPLADGQTIDAFDGFGFNFSDRTIQRGTFVYASTEDKNSIVPVGVAGPLGGIETFKSIDFKPNALSAFTNFVIDAGNTCKEKGNGEIISNLTEDQKNGARTTVFEPLRTKRF